MYTRESASPSLRSWHSRQQRYAIDIHLSVYLSIYLSICLSIYLSVCLSIYLSIYLRF